MVVWITTISREFICIVGQIFQQWCLNLVKVGYAKLLHQIPNGHHYAILRMYFLSSLTSLLQCSKGEFAFTRYSFEVMAASRSRYSWCLVLEVLFSNWIVSSNNWVQWSADAYVVTDNLRGANGETDQVCFCWVGFLFSQPETTNIRVAPHWIVEVGFRGDFCLILTRIRQENCILALDFMSPRLNVVLPNFEQAANEGWHYAWLFGIWWNSKWWFE